VPMRRCSDAGYSVRRWRAICFGLPARAPRPIRAVRRFATDVAASYAVPGRAKASAGRAAN
jgi:hypothetical protein